MANEKIDIKAQAKMDQANDMVKKAKEVEDEQMANLIDVKKGSDEAAKRIKKYAKPISLTIFTFVTSLILGGVGPVIGFLLI